MTRGEEPCVLFVSSDPEAIAWIDFAIELLAGLIALATGISLGRQGYRALRPLVNDLWCDSVFRHHLEQAGYTAAHGDLLGLGWAVITLWLYLWSAHRTALLQTVWRSLGEGIGPRAILKMLLRWSARLLGGGVALAVEIGALALPLGRKLRGFV